MTTPYILTGAFFVSVSFLAWWRTRDVLYPNVFFPLLFLFILVQMPLTLIREDPDRFLSYTREMLPFYQFLAVALPMMLFLGVRAGRRGPRPAIDFSIVDDIISRRLARVGVLIGIVGLATWMIGVMNAGGLAGAYGQAYGGGRLSSGYARELRNVGLIGALMIFLSRRGRHMRLSDWMLIMICIAPTLLHGLLGARRGPLFITAMLLAGGYSFVLGRRINPLLALAGGVALGLLMLFLVANRGAIYIGSQADTFRSGLDFLVRWNSNEYLIGNAVVTYTQEAGGFYGRRQLAHLIGRLVPSALWPTIYQDITALFGLNINLHRNAGVDQEAIARSIGWMPSVGSAMGFIGAMWLEFQYLAPIMSFLVGFLYGRVWRNSVRSPFSRIFFILMVALSVYLVMQDTDAWLYRLVMFYVIAWVIFRFIARRRRGNEFMPSGV